MGFETFEGPLSLIHSYFLYSAILALKLLILLPLSNIVCNPMKLQRANISNLKNLTPFWLVAGLYVTTHPDKTTALMLIRVYVLARFVSALSYVSKLPRIATESAFFVSFAITCFMGFTVVYTYRQAI
ncbi:microsomal glutathione S-transferase 1-like [Plodia interpunctella]|uniref:microsomal glutathione S-transferase 1-like n=1 Tax=Plodia interpunctella TaxID=58824 RepID=UPI002368814A|nr:microsomal glutathione S-transferase 1-like [Plodia interpunctella]